MFAKYYPHHVVATLDTIFHLHFSPFRDVIVLDRDNQAALKQSLEDDARRRIAVFEELDDAGLNFTGVTD